jgi:hypothetical protein
MTSDVVSGAKVQCMPASISVTQSSLTVKVGPGDTGIIKFIGIATANFYNGTTMIIELKASDTWKSSVIVPPVLEFSINDSSAKIFQVTVKVPNGESSNLIGRIIIWGIWTMYPSGLSGESNRLEGRIRIAPYFKFSVSSENSYVECISGEETKFSFNIKNKGNDDDRFSIEVVNIDDLTKNGFKISLSSKITEIPENENRTIEIFVKTPTWVNFISNHELKVKVSSEKNPDYYGKNLSQNLTFNLKLKPGYSHYANIVRLIIVITIAVVIVIIILWLKNKNLKRK